jgi:hypothetical protein
MNRAISKNRLEATIAALEKEQAALNSPLARDRLTDEQIQTIKDFTAGVGKGLKSADFAVKRKLTYSKSSSRRAL